MPQPILKGGKSLRARIRAYHPDVPNAVIAAELGANPATVAVERSRQKRPSVYKQAKRRQNKTYRERQLEQRRYGWAFEWAEAFR